MLRTQRKIVRWAQKVFVADPKMCSRENCQTANRNQSCYEQPERVEFSKDQISISFLPSAAYLRFRMSPEAGVTGTHILKKFQAHNVQSIYIIKKAGCRLQA